MTGTISRSIELIKASFSVLKEEPSLLLFPVLSGAATVLLLVSFAVPLFAAGILVNGAIPSGYVSYILLFLYYVLSYFIVIFFNTGLITCASRRLQGNDPTFADGIGNAVSHIGSIFVWAVIAATVGLILRLIAERQGLLGQIAVVIAGAAWSLATFFVVPVLIFEDAGPLEAIGRSWNLFKKTWGENVIGQAGIGLVFFGIGFIGFLLVFLLAVMGAIGFLVAIILAALLVIVLAIPAASMHGVFVAALYIYATTGRVPEAYRPDLVTGAFAPRSSFGRVGYPEPGNI